MLVEAVRRDGIRLVAFDLRDTLVQPPRLRKVARALIASGVPEQQADLADQAAEKALRGRLAGLPEVVDWKLVELYEAVLALARRGIFVDGPTFERAFRHICDEYRDQTVALVPDEVLLATCMLLAEEHCATTVVTDGPLAREMEIVNLTLPASAPYLPVFASGFVGANKFQPEFYTRLAERFGTEPQHVLVVGNRLDKDIRPAREAGCRTLLLGEGVPDLVAALSPA